MLLERQHNYIRDLPEEIAEKPVAIYPWEERGLLIANSIVADIKNADPSLEVFLGGSLPLKIAGQRDVDIVGVCPEAEFDFHRARLATIFGHPQKEDQASVVWHFIKDDYVIGVYLTNPIASDQFKRQSEMFDLFKKRPDLLKQYEDLKLASDGIPYKIYQQRKYEFFNAIIGAC